MKDVVALTITLQAPDGNPPSEFRIFPFGKIETTRGTFVFDETSAQRVMEAWRRYGNKLHIDYEHQSLEPVTNGPVPAAAWFDLEVRSDGLWAVNVQWTERARELLKAQEYKYFSPAFYTDEKQRVVELLSVALTNTPATRNAPALASRRSEENMKEKAMENGEELLVRLRNVVGKDDPEALMSTIMAWREAAERVEALTRELNELKERERRMRVEVLVQRGLADGRLTPAMREWALSQSPEVLEGFLAVAPVYLKRENVTPPQEPAQVRGWFELSPQEREALYRDDPDMYRRLRREALGF